MKKYEILEWDTNFFALKVAKINQQIKENELINTISEMKNEEVKLVYIFSNQMNSDFTNFIVTKGATLVDKKVTYTRYIADIQINTSQNILQYTDKNITEELILLAIQCGEFSRFKVDPKMPLKSMERLYAQWITNSVNGVYDNAVYVYKNQDKISGLITLKDKDKIGNISLIGVDHTARGQNIGTNLINSAIKHYKSMNIQHLDVVTQIDNTLACKFYEKNNFTIKNVEYVYHLWLN